MGRQGDDELGDLADLILNVGRLIRARTPAGHDIAPLTETERTVMRVVDLHPGCSPSDIARLSRLQRTNVSTTLRSLEDKDMIARDTAGGRGTTVTPTARARTNLRTLRELWARELASILEERVADVRRCTELLAHMERRLIDPD